MSIHRVSPFAGRAATVLVLLSIDVMLGAAAAESETQASAAATVSTNLGASQGDTERSRAAGACRVIDRPKHKIVHCDCSGDPLAGVGSVDAAAILRLFVGNPRCRAPVAAQPRQ